MDDILQGQWKQLRGKIKEQWGNLTDDDLDRVNGQYDQLVGAPTRALRLRQARSRNQVVRLP